MFLQPPEMCEPLDVGGPEPLPEPSPGMQKVMNLSRAVHLQCCIERARRLVDDAALFAASSRVYGDEMQADFDLAGEALRAMRSELGELGASLKKVLNDLGKELAG